MATKRRGPSLETMKQQMDHSYEHRGETGMFGNIFSKDVAEWKPADESNEIAIIPFLCKENSEFRKRNPDLNVPFSDKELKEEDAWAYKLSVFIHGNIGPNKDQKLCLKTLKERCPVCELRDELREELGKLKDKGRTDKDLEERVQALGASKRCLYNIISFNSKKDREKGIMVWSAPHASIEDVIVDRAKDRRSGEYKYFNVIEENWNIAFDKKGKGLNTEYLGVDVIDRRKEDDFTEKEVSTLIFSSHILDEIVEVTPYEQLYELLHGTKPEEAPIKEDAEVDRRSRRGIPDDAQVSRGRDRGRSKLEEAEPSESNLPPAEEKPSAFSDPEAVLPECFGIEFNQRNECEDCESVTFKACMKETDTKSKAPKEDKPRVERSSRRGR